MLHIAHSFLGAARNAGSQHSRGDFLLFMDDDNLAMPHELQTFVTAMINSNVDVLTCFIKYFRGDDPVQDDHNHWWMPEGEALTLGVFYNAFGDANFIIRRSVFTTLQGFITSRNCLLRLGVVGSSNLQWIYRPSSATGIAVETHFVGQHVEAFGLLRRLFGSDAPIQRSSPWTVGFATYVG